MDKLYQLLESIDVYGEPFTFSIFKQENFKTVIGGIMSIFTFLGFIFSFVYFGQDFIFRKNPSYLNQKITLDKYPEYTINNSNLVAAFDINDNNGNPIQDFERFLTIQVVNNVFETITPTIGLPYLNQTVYNLNLMNCSNYDFQSMRMVLKKDLNLSQCINFENIKLGGYFDSNTIKQINVNVKPCINNTLINKNNCYSLPVIYDFLSKNKIWFDFYTNFFYTKLDDFNKPLATSLFNIDAIIQPNYRKSRKIFYKRGDIYTDMGVITQNFQNYSLYGYDFFTFDFIDQYPPFSYSTDKTIMVQYSLVFNANIETFMLIYIKFQTIIANIGGFFTFFNFFSITITGFFRDHLKMLKLINKIFCFQDLKDKEIEKVIEDIKFPHKVIKRKKYSGVKLFHFKDNNNFDPLNITPVINNKKDENYFKKREIDEQMNEARILNSENILNINDKKLMISPTDNYVGTAVKSENCIFSNNGRLKVNSKTKEKFFDYITQYNLKNKKYTFDISFCLLIKNKCCSKRVSSNESFLLSLYTNSRKMINEKMDAVQYLKFIFEYINLKFVLFNEIQTICLELANKPKITQNNLYKTKHEKLEETVKYFIKKGDNLSKEDQKFYKILSELAKETIFAFK